MKNILFVCTGNTCRSSMAEAMFKVMLKDTGLDIEVASAGTSVFFQGGASAQAVEVMGERGIDLSGHSSRQIVNEDIKKADLILTMTQVHKQTVQEMAPEFSGKVFTLKEYVAGDSEKSGGILKKALANDCEAPGKALAGDCEVPEKALADDCEVPGKALANNCETEGIDIVDPFGGTVEDYRACSREIEKALEKLIREIKKRGPRKI